MCLSIAPPVPASSPAVNKFALLLLVLESQSLKAGRRPPGGASVNRGGKIEEMSSGGTERIMSPRLQSQFPGILQPRMTLITRIQRKRDFFIRGIREIRGLPPFPYFCVGSATQRGFRETGPNTEPLPGDWLQACSDVRRELYEWQAGS